MATAIAVLSTLFAYSIGMRQIYSAVLCFLVEFAYTTYILHRTSIDTDHVFSFRIIYLLVIYVIPFTRIFYITVIVT